MQYPTVGPAIKRILLRTAIYEAIVIAAIAGIAYWQKWFTSPIHFDWFGNSFFIAGIFVLIFAGFTVSGVRQMPQGQGAFIAMQSIGTMSELETEARHTRFWTFAGFLLANVTTISLAVAGLLALLIGAIFQVIA